MTEQMQRRVVAHRMAVLQHAAEVTGNVSRTCRYYGISRATFYKWLRRYEDQGEQGLRDRSSRPSSSPRATSAEVVGKIMYLRQSYHFGPHKIAMYLKRYHETRSARRGCGASSAVWTSTGCRARSVTSATRSGGSGMRSLSRDTASKFDVKFISPVGAAGKRFYQFTAIDDCTRLRVLRAYPRCNQQTAIQFLDYLLARLPFRVDVIQTDNGGEFGAQFHYHVLDRGIRHVYIKPATPRLNGKVERSHRIDENEFYRMLDGVVIDDTELFNDRLQEWEDFYNYNRPHGGLDGQTPYERLRQKTQSPVSNLRQWHS